MWRTIWRPLTILSVISETRHLAATYGPDLDGLGQSAEIFTAVTDAAFADNRDRKSTGAQNPTAMTRTQTEISHADRELSSPISYRESVTHLPYMDAVLKETMRLHPSTGLIHERHVPQEGAYICQKHMPAGTVVGINPWVLHRNSHVFPDPDSFLPERWLEI